MTSHLLLLVEHDQVHILIASVCNLMVFRGGENKIKLRKKGWVIGTVGNNVCQMVILGFLFYTVGDFFSGTVCQRWRPVSEESKCDIEIVLRANHVLVTNEQRSRVLITQELVRGNSLSSLLSFHSYAKTRCMLFH